MRKFINLMGFGIVISGIILNCFGLCKTTDPYMTVVYLLAIALQSAAALILEITLNKLINAT